MRGQGGPTPRSGRTSNPGQGSEGEFTTGGNIPVFEELFAGGRIGGARVQVRDPQDTRFGHDLTQDNEFLQVLEGPAPDWRHMAPPCRTFTKARRTDRHGSSQVLRTETRPEGFGDQQTDEANIIADRCVSLAENQMDEGKWFSLENPEPSYIGSQICQTPPQPARRHVGWLGPMRIRWPLQEVNRDSNQLPMVDEAATMRGRTQAYPHQVRGPDMVI